MKGPSAAVFPASVVVVFILIMGSVYVLSVSQDHVYPVWPYVSDCVMLYPETSIFGQVIDIAAALVVWCKFVRLKQVLGMVRELDHSMDPFTIHLRKFIRFLAYFGFLASVIAMFGLVMVASFPENRGFVHYVGAVMAFAGACCCVNSDAIVSVILSHRLRKTSMTESTNRMIIIIRIIVSSSATLFSLVSLTALELSQNYWHAAFPGQTVNDRLVGQLHWNKAFPGYPVRVMSTVCEWLTVALFLVYVCTFIVEFRSFSVRISLKIGPKQRYRRLKSNSSSSQC